LVDVEFLGTGEHDVVPATIERIAGIDDDFAPSTWETSDFEATDNSGAKKVAGVQAVLRHYIVTELLEIILREELSSKEPRTGVALSLACGASAAAGPSTTAG
jgi:hypothetical protein